MESAWQLMVWSLVPRGVLATAVGKKEMFVEMAVVRSIGTLRGYLGWE